MAHARVLGGEQARAADPEMPRRLRRFKAGAELLALSMDGRRDLKVAAVRRTWWSRGHAAGGARRRTSAAAGRVPTWTTVPR
ncbi:hypothetical protein QJS66_00925 [Kocuria rhizophila]|nr:hypothetical protein QJS66_00925 [Kocuria rhizophila]